MYRLLKIDVQAAFGLAVQALQYVYREGRYKATYGTEFKLPWREAGPPNHLDDEVDSDQWVANKDARSTRSLLSASGL
jgi:hypothetical protein